MRRSSCTSLALALAAGLALLPHAGAAQESAWANFDFVPGEKVLFAEDFAKDRVGNFPQRLDLVNGAGEVVQWSGRPWTQFKSQTTFRVKLPQALPERFTIEFDALVPWWGMGLTTEKLTGDAAGAIGEEPAGDYAHVLLMGTEGGIIRGRKGGGGKSTVDPRRVLAGFFDADDAGGASRPVRVRIQVDGRYTKMYLDEVRVANIPNAEWARTNEVLFIVNDPATEGDQRAPMIANLSINAGGQKLYDALMAAGRVATQGIYFDVGSDRIRPESGGTLKEIGDMLKAHAELKLLVEGHTDNTGSDAANLALSDRRAAAVRAHLVSAFGIDGARLASKGFGATKPVSPNTTAEGRQNNRRVELVRQ